MQQLIDTHVHNANWISHYFAQVSKQLESEEPNSDEIASNLTNLLSMDDLEDFEYEMRNALQKMTQKLGFNSTFVLATRSGLLIDETPIGTMAQTWFEENKPR